MKVIGITGGAGAGKSELARIFSSRGFEVIDADLIARQLREPGSAGHAALLRELGTADRDRLRQIAFDQPEARKRIESILHPLIQAESRRRIEELRTQGHPLAFYEAALLVETGRNRELDGLILVRAPREIRLERIQARSGLGKIQAQAILDAQMDDSTREKAADWVFENSGTLQELERQADDWLTRVRPLLLAT